jgi:lipopolysaccharide/colanic/teichoic acid biosynthesis glycosyltransferase
MSALSLSRELPGWLRRGFRGAARGNSDIQNGVACDLEYLENWNPSLEIGIILRTVAQLFLPPQTAY